MRFQNLTFLALLALVLAACGGGGGAEQLTPPIEEAKVTVDGGVTEIDGATSDRAGVELVCRETGERVTTAADGSFAFTALAGGSMTITLDRVPDVRPDIQPDPCARESDDDPSRSDSLEGEDDNSSDEISLDRLTPGERIRLRLRILKGRLERVDISRDHDDKRRVKACMRRTDANDDPNMKGCLIIVRRRDGLHAGVVVKCATPQRDLELVAVTVEGNEDSQGIRTVGERGLAVWRLHRGELPFGAATLARLAGLMIVVRDATTGVDLLVGKFPDVPPPSDDDRSARGKARLVPHEPGLEGYVEIRVRQDGETGRIRQRFTMEAEHLDEGRVVEFFIEDDTAVDGFVSLGMRAANAEGEAELELDTGDEESLPLDVEFVRALVGLAVEVRDAGTGDLLLDGEVPVLMAD